MNTTTSISKILSTLLTLLQERGEFLLDFNSWVSRMNDTEVVPGVSLKSVVQVGGWAFGAWVIWLIVRRYRGRRGGVSAVERGGEGAGGGGRGKGRARYQRGEKQQGREHRGERKHEGWGGHDLQHPCQGYFSEQGLHRDDEEKRGRREDREYDRPDYDRSGSRGDFEDAVNIGNDSFYRRFGYRYSEDDDEAEENVSMDG